MREIDLFLFSTDAAVVERAAAAAVSGFVVDWENIDKAQRQAGADTQVNHDTVDDLRRVRSITDARVICRVNRVGAETAAEVEASIAAGADELFLPMVRGPAEVETVLALVGGRCGVGVLVETQAAVECAPALGKLPLSRAYVGLMDLALDRRTTSIFGAVVDGTVERVRRAFDVPFGFGGLTRPDRGEPVPCRLLMAELARLGCDFSFLRRSFLRDVPPDDMGTWLPRIREAVAALARRGAAEIERDRRDLAACVKETRP